MEDALGILDLLKPGTVGAELGVFTGLLRRGDHRARPPGRASPRRPLVARVRRRLPRLGRVHGGRHAADRASRTRPPWPSAERRAATARCTSTCPPRPTGCAACPTPRSTGRTSTRRTTTARRSRSCALLRDKLRPDGIVLGDDWRPEPSDPHHGVFRAVHELVREGSWDVLRADEHAAVGDPAGGRIPPRRALPPGVSPA